MQDHPTTAYIALGSNLGNREASIGQALKRLACLPDTRLTQVSTMIKNAAVGGPEGSPDFVNAVVEVQTTIQPRQLLHHLHEIERALGRQRREKWGPRVIDLDLLMYGDQCIAADDLTIPHPLMHTRRFVLEPLAQLAPYLVHPTLGLTIGTLLKNLPDTGSH